MPVFEYQCEGCDAELEVIVLPGEQAPSSCSACGGDLRRRWSRVGVQLVGWGFSKTDSLVPESRSRQDFRKVREKAAELFD
jgi:putative FmdB family regulatory protein